jgi:hypothetical protein
MIAVVFRIIRITPPNEIKPGEISSVSQLWIIGDAFELTASRSWQRHRIGGLVATSQQCLGPESQIGKTIHCHLLILLTSPTSHHP